MQILYKIPYMLSEPFMSPHTHGFASKNNLDVGVTLVNEISHSVTNSDQMVFKWS